MIIPIEGKRRRFNGVQVYKARGRAEYMLYVPYSFADPGHDHLKYSGGFLVTTFWYNISTEDLEENWSARFFQQVAKASAHNVVEISCRPNPQYYYPVSWAKTPKVWQELFMRGINDYDLLLLQQDDEEGSA